MTTTYRRRRFKVSPPPAEPAVPQEDQDRQKRTRLYQRAFIVVFALLMIMSSPSTSRWFASCTARVVGVTDNALKH